ncbi:MAG: hypothetical protein AB7F41_03915 [Methylocystis sp.]|uniref:hypothetical protein n=1 Tax=Methylocystis sp. TaxID=1911079 RepID=UPI003D101205
MKTAVFLAAAIAAGSLSVGANAAPMDASLKAPDGSVQNATLSWRCGKKNPASWGTFGNGCLKQKKNWGKGRSSSKPGAVRRSSDYRS